MYSNKTNKLVDIELNGTNCGVEGNYGNFMR